MEFLEPYSKTRYYCCSDFNLTNASLLRSLNDIEKSDKPSQIYGITIDLTI